MNYTFLPNPAVAKVLHQQFNAQLHSSYREMLEQLNDHDSTRFDDALLAAYTDLSPNACNAFFSFVYHHGIQILERSEFAETERLLRELLRGGYSSLPRFVRSSLIDPSLLSGIFGQVTMGTTYKAIQLSRMEPSAEPAVFELIATGEEKLSLVYPELVDEIDALVHTIILFKSEGDTNERALSLTGNRLQSMILINGKFDPSWIFLLDKLVHEAAHAYLFAINLQEELVLNTEGAIYASPLRKDLRDMNAIYHATFVIQRLILAFSRIAAQGDLSDEDRVAVEALLRYYHTRLDGGYDLVMQQGRLSPLAVRLLSEGQETAKSLRQASREGLIATPAK